ncbi:hypothetical protein CEUSTIGMA_g9739.t1 [Chlamydomonas eustigma]|uniref:Uncharacterized protein n=1 Tax=Chlamydomonas eustigma TaxID=1157962 RepID=A0A250XHN3_9CHLO|nr:hypothetical protein CEUSTIGMA_g9739.t1 [Chlamydomonas eustigma]|eukprot:GAX82310.1 hypothetical protein CEUSTIGMA_g9739.t1 [Chlamydomonas eustigma]
MCSYCNTTGFMDAAAAAESAPPPNSRCNEGPPCCLLLHQIIAVSSDQHQASCLGNNGGLDALTSVTPTRCCCGLLETSAGSSNISDSLRTSQLSQLSTDLIIYIISLAAPLLCQCISLGRGVHPGIQPALLPLAPGLWLPAPSSSSGDQAGGADIVEPVIPL